MSEPHCWPTRLDSLGHGRIWLKFIFLRWFLWQMGIRTTLLGKCKNFFHWEIGWSVMCFLHKYEDVSLVPRTQLDNQITRSLGLGASQPSLINEHETNEIPSQESEVDSFWGVTLKVAFWLPYAPAYISALYTSTHTHTHTHMGEKKNQILNDKVTVFCIVHFCFLIYYGFSCYWGASSILLFNWLF